jgi:hypothetical protein
MEKEEWLKRNEETIKTLQQYGIVVGLKEDIIKKYTSLEYKKMVVYALSLIVFGIIISLTLFFTGYNGSFQDNLNITCEKTTCPDFPSIPSCPTCPACSVTCEDAECPSFPDELNIYLQNETTS